MSSICFWCGKEFETSEQGFDRDDKYFCSEKCFHEYNQTNEDDTSTWSQICFWCGKEFNFWEQGFEEYDKYFCSAKCFHEYNQTEEGIVDKKNQYYYCDNCGKAVHKKNEKRWHCKVVTDNLNIQRTFCTLECCKQFYNEHLDEYNRAKKIEEEKKRKQEEERRRQEEEEKRKQEEERKKREYEAAHREEWNKVEKKAKRINRWRLINKTLKDGLFLIVYPLLLVLYIWGILPGELFPLLLFSCVLLYFIYSFFSAGNYIKAVKGKMFKGDLLPGKKAKNITFDGFVDLIIDYSPVFIVMLIINFLWVFINSALTGDNISDVSILSIVLNIPYFLIGGWANSSSVSSLSLGLLNVFTFYFYGYWGLSKNEFSSHWMKSHIFSILLFLYHLIKSLDYFLP